MGVITIFQRVEKKYRLTKAQRDWLLEQLGDRLIPDIYGRSTVCSLYLDTPGRQIIRESIDAKGFDKPAYREKLRIRSYGTPTAESPVFFEIKKKYKGVVYKRRVVMTLGQAQEYLQTKTPPLQSQIMSEIHWSMGFYGFPQPAMLIACERDAYSVKDHPNLRLTFDTNVRGRDFDLSLAKGSEGTLILPEDEVLMEVKTDGAMPLWLSHLLDEGKLYPASFSKYGTAHLRSLKK